MHTFWFFIEAIGTLSFALSGILEARRRKMDLIGVYAAALLTAFGGGTLRDLLLDRHPVVWIQNQEWPLILFGVAVLFRPLFRNPEKHINQRRVQLAIDLTDALGLGLFAALGASISLETLPDKWFIAMIMATVTGVFGGVLRDIVCNEIPNVFKPTRLYATAAFAGGGVYVGCHALGITPATCLIAGFVTALSLRVLALRYDLRLPQ